MNAPRLPQNAGGSLSDLLSAVQHLVQALNGATQAFNNVNGVRTTENITAATVVKATPGRVVSVSVIVAGSAAGAIYDSASAQITTNQLWIIPNALPSDGEPYVVNMPCDTGILVVPASGMTVAVSWS